MENQTTISIAPIIAFIIYSGFLLAVGYWFGKWRGEKKGKADLWRYIDASLDRPQEFIYRFFKNGKGPAKIQGTLIINAPAPWMRLPIEADLPFIFRFEPDKTQWKPGSCCPPHQKSESAT